MLPSSLASHQKSRLHRTVQLLETGIVSTTESSMDLDSGAPISARELREAPWSLCGVSHPMVKTSQCVLQNNNAWYPGIRPLVKLVSH